MNVLITGAAGYIGSNLFAGFAKSKSINKVIGVDNFALTGRRIFKDTEKEMLKSGKARFYAADFYDLETMVPLLEEVDVVVHLAEERGTMAARSAMDDGEVTKWRKNVEGYRRLLEASIICGVKRVILGSWAGRYVMSDGYRMREDEPLAPVDQYYHQKIAQEYFSKLFSMEYFLDTVTLRMSNVYGIGPVGSRWDVSEGPGVISTMAERAVREKEIIVHDGGEQKRNFIHVGDAVSAIGRCAAFTGKFDGKTFNICSDKDVKIIDIAKWISGMCGAKIRYKDLGLQDNVVQHGVSNARAKKALGFRPSGDMVGKIKEVVDKVKKSKGAK